MWSFNCPKKRGVNYKGGELQDRGIVYKNMNSKASIS